MRRGAEKFDVLRNEFPNAHASVMWADGAPTDADLVRAAKSGDTACLGALVERHRPGMRAVALSLLGWGPDADDVVQDATLVALSRLGDLRDPAAAGAWLRSSSRETAVDLPADDLPARGPTPEEVLDGHALRDWVWHALDALSEPLQSVVLLRYFTTATSYEQIAALCDVPIGTVRSRLNQARTKLGHALRTTAATAHADAAALAARRRHEAEDLLSSAENGQFHTALTAASHPDLAFLGPQGQRARGPGLLADMINTDLDAGVHQRPAQVTASRRITILECDLLSPPWDSQHCPPAVLWLMTLHDKRIQTIRLLHPARPATTHPHGNASNVVHDDASPPRSVSVTNPESTSLP